MNRLTPIFIAGAIAVSAGLVFAQSQLKPSENTGDDHSGHSMSTTSTESDGPAGATEAAAD